MMLCVTICVCIIRMKKMKRFKSIFIDLRRRFKVLLLFFPFWLILVAWKRQIKKDRARIEVYRDKMDLLWRLSQKLDDKPYEKQKVKTQKLERELLAIERDLLDYEGKFQKQEVILENTLRVIFDPHFGEES